MVEKAAAAATNEELEIIDDEIEITLDTTCRFEGLLPNFTITFEGRPILDITYHPEIFQPDYIPEEDSPLRKTVERFEKQLRQKIAAATTQLFIEAWQGMEKQPLAFFKLLEKLDDIKSRIGIKRGKKPKSIDDFYLLDAFYDAYHKVYLKWKKMHNDAKRLHGQGKSHEEWQEEWSKVIKESAEPPMEVDLFERLASPDLYLSSPSQLAYENLSRQSGYSVEYLKKMVRKVRRLKEGS